MNSLAEHIVKLPDGRYRLYSKKKGAGGKRKNLGTFGSKKAAQKHEGAVEYFKRTEARVREKLKKGYSRSSISGNIRKEIANGKSQKQAVAIALAIARQDRSKK